MDKSTSPYRTAKRTRAVSPPGPNRAEFKDALEAALSLAADEERIALRLSANKMRMRFEFPDIGLVLNVASGDADDLAWSFDEQVEWVPQIVLQMDSAIANRYLQGRMSLAIAIAHGQARMRGGSRAALFCLPATRLLCEPYRRVISSGYPSLVAA